MELLHKDTSDENVEVSSMFGNDQETKTDLSVDEKELSLSKQVKATQHVKTVSGLVYISFLPPKMTPLHLKQIFSRYGELGRIYLQPDRRSLKKRNAKHSFNRGKFSEGWIEFADKKLAKKIVNTFHNTLIVDGKKGMFSDYTWNLKYLHRFRWNHLTERLRHQQQTYKQKMRIETSQARKETEVFSSNVETSKKITAIKERKLKLGKNWVEKSGPKNYKQRKTVEELRLEKQQKQEPLVERKKVLTNIFGK